MTTLKQVNDLPYVALEANKIKIGMRLFDKPYPCNLITSIYPSWQHGYIDIYCNSGDMNMLLIVEVNEIIRVIP